MPAASPLTKLVVFNGVEYRKQPCTRYFTKKVSGRLLRLHREVWAFHNGPIPDGCDIHHADENPENNDISNLRCLTKSEHGRTHKPRRVRACLHCERVFTRKYRVGDYCCRRCAARGKSLRDFICAECGQGFQSTNADAKFCTSVCGEAYRYRHRPRPFKQCPECGIDFRAMHKVSKYCSRRCAARHRVKRRAGSGVRPER